MRNNIFDFDYLPWRYLPNWPKNIGYFFRKFKYAYQRITRGYADIDIWDFDHYLSYIISNGAKHLADTTCSHPIDKTYEEWQEYLREMASHFDKVIELQEKLEDPTAEFAEGMKMLQDVYLDLWD